jgi:hypothetical protein
METSARRRSRIVFLGFLLAGTACIPGLGRGRRANDIAPSDAVTRLVVTNNYGFPLSVYAIGAGTTQRMGTVLPGIDASFRLPPGMVVNGPVEFVVLPGAGHAEVRSGRLLLTPGDVVDFSIGVHLLDSMATVRP